MKTKSGNNKVIDFFAILAAFIVAAGIVTVLYLKFAPEKNIFKDRVVNDTVTLTEIEEETAEPETVVPIKSAEKIVSDYAKKNSIDMSEYPEKLIKKLAENPEIEDFVLEYPLKKDFKRNVDLSEYEDCEGVPLFMQWDQRWGYTDYAGDMVAFAGCGAVSLSMVAYYYNHSNDMSPDKVIDYAVRNGYAIKDDGTSWSLMTEGCKKFGLTGTAIPLDKSKVKKNLKKGYPVICIMGKGQFTSSGHFIVLTGVDKKGNIIVNDCNSKIRSSKTYDFDDIKDEIRNLWVMKKAGA